MKTTGVTAVRQGFEAYARGEPMDLSMLDPRVEVHDHDMPDGDVYTGVDGWLRWVSSWSKPFRDFRAVPAEFIESGDKLVVLLEISAGGAAAAHPCDDATAWC